MAGLEILHEVSGSVTAFSARGRGKTGVANVLLGPGFCHPSRDDVRYDVPGLDPSEEKLADLPQSTHGVEIGLSERTNTERR